MTPDRMDPLAEALLTHRRICHRDVHLLDGRPRHRPDDRGAPGQHCTVFAAPSELELTAQPWWPVPDNVATAAAAALPAVRAEVSALLAAGGGNPTDRHGMALGFHDGWLTMDLLRDGRWIGEACKACPATVALLKSFPLCDCSLARAYFSILKAGKSISPHHGRSNAKLRMQLPLLMGTDGHCEMTVGGETRQYDPDGSPLLFDDSFLHEVHNRSETTDRVVLLCDLWHPDVSAADSARIAAVFKPPRRRRRRQTGSCCCGAPAR